ncbi:BF3164 family lipoprotein [Coprobacter tertius]|uniref:6-bladed beta-propeller n=1 Tax=Coprobacter tertius TaxID=2944915 RepID=A0ABT1MJ47_9BACT|nr:6-bladed beta-propeller [Coprobacter tertius]MCP9612649.1 6-bladed beta-propeller [Coprobacter tertius]
MKLIKLFALVFIICYACSSEKKIESDLTKINVNPSETGIALDIANNIEKQWEIIPLETKDECLVNEADKILYKNGIYYILDRQGNSLFLFDSDGKFISKILKKGEGPDEYSNLDAFAVDNDSIWISDASSRSLICYGPDLKMIDRASTWERATGNDITLMNGKIYLATNWTGWNKKNSQIASYDIKNKDVTGLWRVPPLNGDHALIRKSCQLADNGDSCLFIYSYCDTIFQIKDNKLTPAYQLSFTERYDDVPLPIEKLMDPQNKNIIRGIDYLKQTNTHIFFSYADDGLLISVIYNKKDNSCKTFPYFINSNLGEMKTYLYTTFFDGNNMICVYEPETIKNNDLSKISDIADREKFKQVSESLKSDDNPVLIKYKLKDF